MRIATLFCSVVLAAFGCVAVAQQAPAAASPAAAQPATAANQMVVTVLAKKGPAPAVKASDVVLRQGKFDLPVSALEPLTGDNARMELYIALDDDGVNLDPNIDQIRAFINALPPTTAVGIVYLRSSVANILVPFTLNHAAAAKAMRVPSGQSGVSPSPFESISALFQGWPLRPNRRRELLVFTDGIEEFTENNSKNPLLDAAVAQAQQGGIVVYGIWMKGSGTSTAAPVGSSGGSRGGARAGSTMSDVSSSMDANIGQGHLTVLAQHSGGEIYLEGANTPRDLHPYLADISARMQAQYRLIFTPPPGTAGGLLPVKLDVKLPNTIVAAPTAIEIRP